MDLPLSHAEHVDRQGLESSQYVDHADRLALNFVFAAILAPVTR